MMTVSGGGDDRWVVGAMRVRIDTTMCEIGDDWPGGFQAQQRYLCADGPDVTTTTTAGPSPPNKFEIAAASSRWQRES